MSLSINTNVGAMVALESLNQTTNELNDTQNAVSTGLKVSTAADNPASYTIAQSMNGNIQGLSAVSDGLSYAGEVVSTTSTAVSGILSTLQSLQSAVTSLGSNTGDPSSLAKIGDEINGYLDTINTEARNATVNGVNLLTSADDANTANQGTAGATAGAVTSASLTYLTGLQGSTTTIQNAVTGSSGALSSIVSVGSMAASTGTATLTDALGLSSGSTAGQLNATNVFVTSSGTLNDNTISDMVSMVQNAITAMNKVSSTLGSNTQTITAMTTYSSNLSDSLTASVGALTDADMAAESAKLTSLQTKQQLAISSLSVAKSSSSNILSLFR
ncbi:flagellin [Acetobacter estunensis]|uniref:flagellin n=1 Tax=Acetobacter estunensis TaxID=104097 RepID=UPI001C2D3663|nr:flagellin [Acetobacter estunensis]MBV1837666.1 flagellin [Acetobacter estunensis]